MSVVNKMLNDLENRDGDPTQSSADYQKSQGVGSKRLMVLVGVLLVLILGYFIFRTVGGNYFVELLEGFTEQEEVQPPANQVSASTELNKMMPTRSQPQNQTKTEDSNTDANQASSVSNSVESDIDVTPLTEEDLSPQSGPALNDGTDTQTDTSPGLSATELAALDEERAPKVLLSKIPSDNEPLDSESLSGDSLSEQESAPSGSMQVSRALRPTQDEQVKILLNAANEAIQKEDLNGAIIALDSILEVDPKRHGVRKRLAVLLYSQNQERMADTLLRDGIALTPERIDLRLMLGRLLQKQHKNQELYDILAYLDPDIGGNSEYLALKASAAQQLEMHAEAVALFGRLVVFEPDVSRWWLGLAISHDKLGATDLALSSYLKVYELRQMSVSVLDFVNRRIEALGG